MCIDMDRDTFWNLPENELMALTIWAEARSEPYDGRRAVGSVILNRRDKNGWFGKTIHEVCLKPFQFSCYNRNDPQYTNLANIASNFGFATSKYGSLRSCLYIANGLIDGTIPKYLNIDHYHTLDIHTSWDDKMEVAFEIGNHRFYVG